MFLNNTDPDYNFILILKNLLIEPITMNVYGKVYDRYKTIKVWETCPKYYPSERNIEQLARLLENEMREYQPKFKMYPYITLTFEKLVIPGSYHCASICFFNELSFKQNCEHWSLKTKKYDLEFLW